MKKLYVLIRKDLSKSQQAVQGGHAVAEYLLHGRLSSWDNGTLIYLAAENEKKLKSWGEFFHTIGVNWIGFNEPDRNNELTAIAVLLNEEDQWAIKDLRLL